MAEIAFLHFTDLHWGQHGLGHFWSTYKTNLKEDLKKLRDKVGRTIGSDQARFYNLLLI